MYVLLRILFILLSVKYNSVFQNKHFKLGSYVKQIYIELWLLNFCKRNIIDFIIQKMLKKYHKIYKTKDEKHKYYKLNHTKAIKERTQTF